MLAHQALPRKSHPAAQVRGRSEPPVMRKQQEGVALQESEAQNEIAPEDVKYRLETLPKAPLELQRLSYFSQPKPPWIHLSTTYGESHKPWTYYGEEPSHSGDHYLTTPHQIAFQSSPLGQSMFPVYIRGRKIASVMHPDYRNCINQYERDFQAPECNQVLKPDPDKSSQGINKYIQTLRRLLAPVWQPTTHRHEKLSCLKQETPTLGGKRAAKCDGDAVTRGTASQAPAEDQTTTRTSYLPLFSERVKLCKPKINSINCQPSCRQASSRHIYAKNRTQH
ncbi:CEP57 [Cervus elaphus hippelaphus]|uniref:CEP57 n=1 Tax=Cervus elaphus hippelaphus TaxID=46360 RepID=A0A212DHC0_CEREH|nr:CEP57 [Cervus elaphus hippelaphus]